jgi:hypothetical protein
VDHQLVEVVGFELGDVDGYAVLAVVLTRLTAIGAALSMEILSVANEERAHAIPDDPEHMRAHGPGASIAVVHDRDAVWVPPLGGTASGGSGTFRSTAEFAVSGPDGDVLDLMVAWPAAGLPDVCVGIPLSAR